MVMQVPCPIGGAPREFHVSRTIRDACDLPDTLFSVTGNVIFADFHAARDFAHRLNTMRDAANHPERAVSASEIYALGLIDEILHLVVANHCRQRAPHLWSQVLGLLGRDLGEESIDRLLGVFVEEFPPTAVYRGELSGPGYLAGETDGVAHRDVAMEELVMLWLANSNPAFAGFRELFDDGVLRRDTDYVAALEQVETILGGSATGGPAGETLLDLLYAPMRAAPISLEGQLEFVRGVWAGVLGPELHRVLGSLDFLTEEQRVYFPPGPGPVAAEPPDYRVLAEEGENYSDDREWMPRLVLLAKNAHVWLAQLSKSHGREISTLDGVPDEELEVLARRGITGLWLIGVWQRSPASERIKKMMGDEDAVASAYSLEDYRIADALGGEGAYDDLRDRAWRHGIRLSTDMVPNHMGSDSNWVINHPDWFLTVDRSPYPSYTFNGPDLSEDERVGIFIEDGYWDRSDAAVVFKRVDHNTGDERYVYHGNDGTSMPWNDTAQLDYLHHEVREAVIQTILSVARRSPVIRFDAAMTLARQHYHRLWFPEPGAAGAVPSRAEFSMTRADFDAAMPHEFWREVVDRVAAEAPDTLLLAEAFWLLEGYFVRTLGMHRVYNSAFMNMLRDERNSEYRQLIRSTLEFDPQILKRYVNFMSNPDERTAVDQFGTGDKYFGVATLLATTPGLPMLGHGQIEGLEEKYGMEFQRPRWEEETNEGLVRRHESQIFPLLSRRRIFAEVDRFLLFDFVKDDGAVDENVIAYSNDVDGERSLVVFHNLFGDTRGRIQLSTSVAVGDGDGERHLVQSSVGDGLRVPDTENWLVFRDAATNQEFLRSCQAIRRDGFDFELGAYQLHCFVDFREVAEDENHPYAALAEDIGSGGVPSVEAAVSMRAMAPILGPVRRLLCEPVLHWLAKGDEASGDELRRRASTAVGEFLEAVGEREEAFDGSALLEGLILSDVESLLMLNEFAARATDEESAHASEDDELERSALWATLLMWALVRRLGDNGGASARHRFKTLNLDLLLTEAYESLGLAGDRGRRAAAAVDLMIASDGWDTEDLGPQGGGAGFLTEVFGNEAGRIFLGVNEHNGETWFNREALEELVVLMLIAASVDAIVEDGPDAPQRLAADLRVIDGMKATAAEAGYRVGEFLDAIGMPEDGPAEEA